MSSKGNIALVDYGMGNLRSVEKALQHESARVIVTQDPKKVLSADKIVVPGVGAFSQAMRELKKRKLDRAILKKIKAGTPYLGLCLGLQILLEGSEEGSVKGLGLIRGSVRKFRKAEKIPHMGWNTFQTSKKNCPLFRGLKKNEYFYFVHSYYAVPKDKSWVLAITEYGEPFCSALWKDNVYATQFHPEKSQAAGLRLLRNFVTL